MSEQSQTTSAKKTIILVHGAWANGSSWNKVIPFLQAQNFDVTAVHLPLRSLADDAGVVKRAIAASIGEVILVGHSWGGMVITQAGTDEKVAALVYVAAFAPSENQSVNDLFKDYPQPEWLGGLRVDSGGFAALSPETVRDFFAPDLSAAEIEIVAATQAPLAASANDDKATAAAWREKPSWYIVADGDRMIDPNLERALAEKLNAETTVSPTGHVAMLAAPREVAEVIINAANYEKSSFRTA